MQIGGAKIPNVSASILSQSRYFGLSGMMKSSSLQSKLTKFHKNPGQCFWIYCRYISRCSSCLAIIDSLPERKLFYKLHWRINLNQQLTRLKCKSCARVKFIYSEKATKFCEIFTLLLSYVVPVKSKVKISAKFCGLLRIYELEVKFTMHKRFFKS